MSDENISRIERSEVAGIMTHRLPALAEALGISLEELNQTIVAPPDATLSGPRPAGHVLRVSVEVVHGLQRQAEARGLSVEELLANFAGVENRTPRRNAAKPIGKRPAERFRKPRLGQGRPPKPNP